MAFNDAPIVDDNSKRSEESVNAVRAFFTKRNGFIYREETPDYGVDVDVELIVQGKDASSWKFPIQIKSKKELNIIDENGTSLISFPFVVSRLGYLSRRAPAYGIVILYDEKEKICYFDYVDAIINRLNDHPERNNWRDQDSVSILIPPNIINEESLAQIHQIMVARHENHQQLIAEHGNKFNIPYLQVSKQVPVETDLTDPVQAGAFLIRYGIFLFNEQEYIKILTLMGLLNGTTIGSSIDLLFLATITYTRIGNVVEAEYYLKKIKRCDNQLTIEQKGVIQFSELRLDFLKGNINYRSFLNQLSALEENIEGVENKLVVKINRLYFELNERALAGNFEIEVKNEIDALTLQINQAQLTQDQKHLLLVYHAENINSFALESFLHFNSNFQLSQSLQIEVPMHTRVALAKFSTDMMQQAIHLALDAYRFAESNEFFLLKATAAHNLGKFFFQTKYYLLMQGIKDDPDHNTESITDYRRYYAFSVTAYNHFMKLHMQQSAHEAVANAYELQSLCLKLHSFQLGNKTGAELMSMIRSLENANSLTAFDSAADLITKVLEKRKSATATRFAAITDEEIRKLAMDALNLYNLSEDRLPNMITEIKAMRVFDAQCKNPDIDLLTNNMHLNTPESRYAMPPVFVLQDKQSKFQTPPDNEIDRLLRKFKHLLDK